MHFASSSFWNASSFAGDGSRPPGTAKYARNEAKNDVYPLVNAPIATSEDFVLGINNSDKDTPTMAKNWLAIVRKSHASV
mmetsp:Transcript_3025/g.8174  ORF Transcript_3025/g.8174 Transcript_3025/m.8174 type:complete len:80 (+) Transcript_3025:521-760(+)